MVSEDGFTHLSTSLAQLSSTSRRLTIQEAILGFLSFSHGYLCIAVKQKLNVL